MLIHATVFSLGPSSALLSTGSANNMLTASKQQPSAPQIHVSRPDNCAPYTSMLLLIIIVAISVLLVAQQ